MTVEARPRDARRWLSPLAWSLALLSSALAGSAVTGAVASGMSLAAAVDGFVVTNAVMGLSFPLCGLILATRRPANPIGWLFLADDHPVVRDGLAALLKFMPGMTVADTVADGRAAVRAAVTLQPDVLVMDIQMPGLNGVEATAEITRVAPTVAILMLTMFDDDESVFAAMRAGAAGYVLKGAEQDQIIRAIRAVAEGEAIFGPGIARRVLGYLSGPSRPTQAFPQLTAREREVLDLLAAGLPNTAIGNRLGLASKTVSNHISSIFAKLQVASRAEAADQARAAGLGRM